MTKIKTKEDIEVFDFIVTVINAYSNCDTWGEMDMCEKHEMCDRAIEFLYKNFTFEDK